MKIYEKAIENYVKERKKFHKQVLKLEIDHFSRLVEKMAADGKCPGFRCKDCPVRLAVEEGIEIAGCGVSTSQEKREIITRKIKK